MALKIVQRNIIIKVKHIAYNVQLILSKNITYIKESVMNPVTSLINIDHLT